MKLKTATELRQLQKIHQLAGIGYWVYRYSSKVMWWSDVTYSIFGYKIKSISPSREKLLEHIHPKDLYFFEEALRQMQKQAVDMEFRFYRNGQLRLGKITGEVYRDNELIEEVLFQDITDIKIKEFEVEKAWNKAIDAENLKNVFLANMSHELRTPLNSIIGFSELLETGTINGIVPKFANSIKISGLQLLKVIEDLFKVSMLESKIMKPVKNSFNLNQLIQEVKENCIDSLKVNKKEHLKLEFYPNDTSCLVVKSDRDKITCILKNLLHNAIKFTEEGIISCSYIINNQSIQFSVSDTGPGIPKKYRSSIFKRFRQVDEHISRYGGIGLGLYISKLEIELLGGEIGIVSEKGIGTTVNFSIPNVIEKEDLD